MAKALRIDTLELLGDDRVRLTYTRGTAPLPMAQGGEGIIWSSKDDAVAALDAADAALDSEGLLLLLLAVWRRANPALNNPAIVIGKTMTFDVTPTTITITVT